MKPTRSRATQTTFCGSCRFFVCPIPDSESASAGDISSMTDEGYTGAMLAPAPERVRASSETAERRYRHFETLVGRPLRILEIGCGAGLFGAKYSEIAKSYVGLDIDSRVIGVAMRKGIDARNIDLVEFRSDTKFDLITCSQVIEHIFKPLAALDAIERLLAPGGYVHIDVPNHNSLAGLPTRLLPSLSQSRFGGIESPHHCNSYTVPAMTQLLSRFSEVEVFTADSTNPLWGQGIAATGMNKVYFGLARLTVGNLVVGVARLRNGSIRNGS
jgi:SAM-dependent methyltransferase